MDNDNSNAENQKKTIDDDCDTNSTIIYPLENVENSCEIKSESLKNCVIKSASENNLYYTDLSRFSPLPSTSDDNVIIDLNDTRFKEAIGFIDPPLVSFDKVEAKPSACDSVIECSSGSEIEETTNIVTVKRGRKKRIRKRPLNGDIIDLLQDEKIYDSDCEIVDVDQLLAENKAALSNSPSNYVIQPNDIIEVKATPSSADLITSIHEDDISGFERIKRVLNDFFETPFAFQPTEEELNSFETFFNSTPQIVMPQKYQNPSEHNRRKRGDTLKPKRRRTLETVSLSSSINNPPTDMGGNSSVIIIDSEPPSVENLGLPVEVSKSNVTPVDSVASSESSTLQRRNVTESTQTQSDDVILVGNSDAIIIGDVIPTPAKAPSTPPKSFGDCPVCLESFAQVNAVSTFCGHIFCLPCITQIKLSYKKCPKCRKALKGKGFHPIFF